MGGGNRDCCGGGRQGVERGGEVGMKAGKGNLVERREEIHGTCVFQ